MAQESQAMGKAGMRFLKEHCFFCPPEHEAPLDASVLVALFESQGLVPMLQVSFDDPLAGRWYSFTFPGVSSEACIEDGAEAWHGTNMFRLCDIVSEGRLKPGPAEPRGIYCHKLGSKSKAQSYAFATPIGRGIFAMPLLKLRVLDPERVRVDQWIVKAEKNCSIEAVMVRLVQQSKLSPGREWLTPGMC